MRNRLGSLTAELLAVDHPLVRHEDIRINEHQDVVVMLDVYFDDAGFGTHTFTTPKGTRAEHARPMFESRLTVGPVITVDAQGNPNDAPPILQEMSLDGNRLTLELLDSRIILCLGEHPRATLEITDHITCYDLKKGLLHQFVREPQTEL